MFSIYDLPTNGFIKWSIARAPTQFRVRKFEILGRPSIEGHEDKDQGGS